MIISILPNYTNTIQQIVDENTTYNHIQYSQNDNPRTNITSNIPKYQYDHTQEQ